MDEPKNHEKPEPSGFWKSYTEGKPETPLQWVQFVLLNIGFLIMIIMGTIAFVMIAIYVIPILIAGAVLFFLFIIFFGSGSGGGGGPPDVRGPTPM